MTSMEVSMVDQVPVINPQDLTDLGVLLASTGLTQLQARALMAKMQHLAATVAVGMMPEILEEIRRIQEARFMEIYNRIRLLPNNFGWVSRDRVIQVIQNVAASQPRM
jgi:hypothetical protein